MKNIIENLLKFRNKNHLMLLTYFGAISVANTLFESIVEKKLEEKGLNDEYGITSNLISSVSSFAIVGVPLYFIFKNYCDCDVIKEISKIAEGTMDSFHNI